MAFGVGAFNPARARSRMRGVFYGWWLVPISGIVHMTTSVPLFHAMGLWFVALESAFGLESDATLAGVCFYSD